MTDAAQPALTRPISLAEFRDRRAPPRNAHEEAMKSLSPLARLAVWITERVGSMGFFLLILAWTVFWLGWNFLAPKTLVFDQPMGFVFWLFISNVIQILLMPLIMVGQNVISAQSEARADYDLEVNVKAEEEIEVILHHLEYQNEILLKMLEGLKLDIAAVKPAP
jgi:uncharacterized membrane protein